MGKYSLTFGPLTVKQMTTPNRIVMTPMGTNSGGQNGEVNSLHINYYEQRAMGSTGLIVVENACVDYPCGFNGTTQPCINHDNYIPRLCRLVEMIHEHNTKIVIQLNHARASTVEERIGMWLVGANDMLNERNGAAPRALSKKEILYIIDCYAKAAKCAQIIGFDVVEIHARYSYLINQFLSPLTNKRTDEFGGNYGNHTRSARLVLEAIREEAGAQFLAIVRISAGEFLKGGNTLESTLKLPEYFHAEVDIIDIFCGLVNSIQYQIDTGYLSDGWRSYVAKTAREAYAKPVIATGSIRDPKVTEDILERGDADLIGMGHQVITDSSWINKAHYGKEDTIRRCISCSVGCSGHCIGLNRPVRCSVNPSVDKGEGYRSWKVKKLYNVAVIGGSTTGLEAACTAAEVGRMAFLIEKEDHLGELSMEISRISDKKRPRNFPDYLIHRAEKLHNLITFTFTEVTPSLVKTLKPDFIINTTGSTSLPPSISRLRGNIDVSEGHVSGILDMIRQISQYPKDLSGKKVYVVDGGAVGLDVVESFARCGVAISIVEIFPVVGKDLDTVTRVGTYGMLGKHNIQVLISTVSQEVYPDYLVVKRSEQVETLDFDYGFACLSIRAYSPIMGEPEQTFAGGDVELFNIGDSVRARRIIDGMIEGRNIPSALKQKELLWKRNGTRYIKRNQLWQKELVGTQN